MGCRLFILSWWTPEYILRKELQKISDRTTAALEALVTKYVIGKVDGGRNKKQQRPTGIQQQRNAMAQTHAKLVEELEAAVGHEEAVRIGRETLFSVGKNLGEEARRRLGVGDNPADLTKAAKILYRVLGIKFHVEWLDNSNAIAIIDQCALSQQYSKLTCEVLSATDEGVMRGLQPNVTMKFREYITSGCKTCRADIRSNEKEIMK